MRLATAPHHTNPRSATLDFWRRTSSIDSYRHIQAKRRQQTNRPTSSNQQKEEHLIIASRMAEMEKRRVGTRFMEYEVDADDFNQPLFVGFYSTVSKVMHQVLKQLKLIK